MVNVKVHPSSRGADPVSRARYPSYDLGCTAHGPNPSDSGGSRPPHLRRPLPGGHPLHLPIAPFLKDISLSLTAGKTTALVGTSGFGKSNILTLKHFYDPSEDVVRLYGVDVRELNLKSLRVQLGLVAQESAVFNARCATTSLRAHTGGVQGYHTLVGERVFLLSGGQKQHIAIARAIVADAKTLLLDEATSAFNTLSEGAVLPGSYAGRPDVRDDCASALDGARRVRDLHHGRRRGGGAGRFMSSRS
ncbi:P-loop containing nucleoside triphosphate hydrolase protein [Mycena capillaripes]|nr:P-loop containing nucleoside triphosphate hydrolase protein [Mycena capillaripes]